ncbi:hypothetical protein T4D_2709 [Trichinella pseudospiralis]|uniref:Uncharacterized protein n=1 Tax=Trichinella pseudospiralis TaxID=6337 RepID=A0A0V1FN16_TRIPS|nr:hypothetical protein T4D_2709 [Trichinella pseudospiralis]
MHKKGKFLASFHLRRSHTGDGCWWWLTETVVSNCLFIGHSVGRRGAKLKKTTVKAMSHACQCRFNNAGSMLYNLNAILSRD